MKLIIFLIIVGCSSKKVVVEPTKSVAAPTVKTKKLISGPTHPSEKFFPG